jgi:DNA-binding SARP family transcriptional activator
MQPFQARGSLNTALWKLKRCWSQRAFLRWFLREEIHREMMHFSLKNGQRALAIRQNKTCRASLQKELGIPPMEDLQALYAQIIAACNTANQAVTISGNETNFSEALRQLKEANQTIDLAKEQIQHAFKLIANFSEKRENTSLSRQKGKD